jgi:hypothetical protein
VDVYVLGISGEHLLDGGVAQRGGARAATLRVRLHLRERALDLLAVLVAVPLVALPFLGVLPMLVGLPFF